MAVPSLLASDPVPLAHAAAARLDLLLLRACWCRQQPRGADRAADGACMELTLGGSI